MIRDFIHIVAIGGKSVQPFWAYLIKKRQVDTVCAGCNDIIEINDMYYLHSARPYCAGCIKEYEDPEYIYNDMGEPMCLAPTGRNFIG